MEDDINQGESQGVMMQNQVDLMEDPASLNICDSCQ